MIKKYLLITCCLISSHLLANEDQPAEIIIENSDRFQMQVVMNKTGSKTEVYLLDKEKNIIWVSFKDYGCQYSSWMQLPPLPIEEATLQGYRSSDSN